MSRPAKLNVNQISPSTSELYMWQTSRLLWKTTKSSQKIILSWSTRVFMSTKSYIAPKLIFYICCIFFIWKVSFEKLVQSESRHSVKVLLVKVLLKQVHNFVTILRADSKFRDRGLNSLEKSATNRWTRCQRSFWVYQSKYVQGVVDHQRIQQERQSIRTTKREIGGTSGGERQQTQKTLWWGRRERWGNYGVSQCFSLHADYAQNHDI